MSHRILIIDKSEERCEEIKRDINHGVLTAKNITEAVSLYSSTDFYIGLTLMDVTEHSSFHYQNYDEVAPVLRMKNQVYPTIAYYRSGEVTLDRFKTLERYHKDRIFLELIRYKDLLSSCDKIKLKFNETNSLAICTPKGLATISAPDTTVPLHDEDIHPVSLMCNYGGIIKAAFNEKQHARIKAYFAVIDIDIISKSGWLIIKRKFENKTPKKIVA